MTETRVSKQGQSDATEFKERGLEAAFSINLSIFNRKFGSRFPYFHFDLNSGSGINEKVGCIGSPLAFVRAAESVGCTRYFAGFCDIEQEFIGQLMAREEVQRNNRCFCFHGDNASLIDAIPDIIAAQDRPSRAIGMVLSDPNGFEVPLDKLAWLSTQCPGLDIVVHWNSRVRRLYRGKEWPFIDIDEAVKVLNKRHWLIREPRGAHQWTVLIGRNIQVGDHKQLGFWRLESPKGADIIDRCRANPGESAHPQSEMEF